MQAPYHQANDPSISALLFNAKLNKLSAYYLLQISPRLPGHIFKAFVLWLSFYFSPSLPPTDRERLFTLAFSKISIGY